MLTRLSSATKEVLIGDERPTVLIGERINPTGKKKLAAALQAGDLEVVRKEALAQVAAGAAVLDVNVGVGGLDQVELLPKALKIVMETVDVPICIDSANPEAVAAALKVYKGKPLINSVNGEEKSMNAVLPLVKEFGTAVIALCMDDNGIPPTVDGRLAVAHKIIDRAAQLGIPAEDIIIDCLTLTVGTDHTASRTTIESIKRVKAEIGSNMTVGASNVSFGLPEREVINNTFLTAVIVAGVTCPIVDVAKVAPTVLATDLLLGRDEYAGRYLKGYRARLKAAEEAAKAAGGA